MPEISPTVRKRMVIDRIDIFNFKNIPESRLEFSPGVNCLLGSNGMGKSNLLEAIHFLCIARPMSSLPESGLIRHGEDMMSVNAAFTMDNASLEKVSVSIVKGKGKTLKRNGKDYGRIADHIGRFPIVSVTPADSDLVKGSAQERRRMTDMVISQANASYLSNLMRYNRSLESRNNMLRSGVRDPLLYESVEAIMAESAAVINQERQIWIDTIAPMVAANYSEIAGGDERLSISYSSALNAQSMAELFERNRAKDAALGFTSSGIHRDDIEARLNGYNLKNYGSQGQVKTFTIALRLAIFNFIRRSGGETPLLLLDDIFDKLDSSRVSRIMQLVSRDSEFGQIFITDTNREHLDETLAGLTGPKQLIEVESGCFSLIS